MSVEVSQLKRIVEAALLAAGKPLSLQQLAELFEAAERPQNSEIRDVLGEIERDYADRGFELKIVASGYRFQVQADLAPWVGRLWEERPQRYSRALLETLSLIAYRQPITRGDIEEIRGVAVSSHIVKTLLEREWVRVVGHKDVPGRPAMYATTRQFLDYFNLRNLDELPNLAEISELDSLNGELALDELVAESDTTGNESPELETEDVAEMPSNDNTEQLDSPMTDSEQADEGDQHNDDPISETTATEINQ
ncbi:MAG: SMC-Scp complex subunit ScpB [Spongiibacteraceae bacterium]